MKTLTKTFARRVISALLVTIMVFSLGITSIVSTSAAEVELAATGGWAKNVNCVVYFDNTNTNWSNVKILIGRDYTYNDPYKAKGSVDFDMTPIPNTNLYYCNLTWDYATTMCFVNASGEWGWKENETVDDRNNNVSSSSLWYFDDADNVTGNQFFTPNSSGTLSHFYYSDLASMNTDTHKVVVRDITSGTSKDSASAGTVTVEGYYHNVNTVGQVIKAESSTTTTNNTADVTVVQSSSVKLTPYPAQGYKFVGWTSTESSTTATDTSNPRSYNSTGDKTYYALFEKSTSLSAGTLSVTPSAITLGEQLTFKTTANLTGASGNITYQLYEDGKKVNGVEVKVASGTQASITYTPTSAGEHTYFIRASYGELEDVDTAPTTITVAENLTATLELSETGTIVEGVSFGFVIGSNAGSLGDNSPTYKLFCKSESDADFVEVTSNATIIDGGVVTYTVSTAGTYQFKASVTMSDGKSTETNVVDVTVEENTPEIKLTVDHKGDVVAGTPATITATAKPNHIPYTSITYTLTSATIQGFSMPDSTTGAFTIPANVTENLSGKHTFTVNAHAEYEGYDAVDRQVTFYITFNQPTGSDNVRVYFKSSVSWGYRPNISVNGADFVEMDTYQFLSKNSTQVAEYGWFGYNLGEVQMGDKVNITIKGNRDYFYTGTYTLDLLNETKIIPDDSGDGKAIYLALDNLNVASSSGTPMENITDSNNKHWVATATHMIIANDVSADPLAALAYSYTPVAVGDANNDGKVNVRDATLIQKDLAKVTELTPLGNQVSDVNFDGKLTVKDATAIQKQIAGL